MTYPIHSNQKIHENPQQRFFFLWKFIQIVQEITTYTNRHVMRHMEWKRGHTGSRLGFHALLHLWVWKIRKETTTVLLATLLHIIEAHEHIALRLVSPGYFCVKHVCVFRHQPKYFLRPGIRYIIAAIHSAAFSRFKAWPMQLTPSAKSFKERNNIIVAFWL